MSKSKNTGVSVYICRRCLSEGVRFPRQWMQDGIHVCVTELPCSGKTDAHYLFHAIEGGARGLLVVTCPVGECHLSQGNYRAEIRVRTVQRLLSEIGMEPERAQLIRCAPTDDAEALIRKAVSIFAALEESPMIATG